MNLFDEYDWGLDAACRGRPTEWWYGEEGTSYDPHKALPAGMRRALFACWNKCPVRTECLQAAIDKPELYGIWGGTLPHDRIRHKNVADASAVARRRVERVRIVAREEKTA